MKVGLILAIALLPGFAAAQFGQVGPAIQVYLKERNNFPIRGSEQVPTPKKVGELPDPNLDDGRIEFVRSGEMFRGGDKVRLDGGVEFLYRGYRTICDRANGDTCTGIFRLQGNVRVIGKDTTLTGDVVTVDYHQRTYRAEEMATVIVPALTTGNLRDNLYASGKVAFGNEAESRIYFGSLTTCDYDAPHFELVSDDATLRTGKRLILRKARLFVLGYKVVTIPYLSIPLDNRRYNYLPEFGQNDEEGYYVKNRAAIEVPGENTLDTRQDYMSKLGVGLGGTYGYRSAYSSGAVTLYGISGRASTRSFRNQHQQSFSGGSFAINNDFQQDNYLGAAGTQQLSNQAQLTLNGTDSTTNVSYQRNTSKYQSSESLSETYSLGDNRRIGEYQTTFDLSFLKNENRYPGSSNFSAKEADLRLQLTRELSKLTAGVEYARNIPIGDNPNFFTGNDRTPVLTVSSDSTRLLGADRGKSIPFRTSLSIGEFGSFTEARVNRTYLDWNYSKADASERRLRLDTNASFRQGLYSDGTAQYTVGGGLNATYRLGTGTSANLRYYYQRPEGYTPVAQDRDGKSHNVTTDISYRPQRYLLLGAQTGFDFLRSKTSDIGWQQVGLRSEFRPAKWFSLRALSTYDTISQVWSSFRLDLSYLPGATFVTFGARYDGYQRKWSNGDLYLNNLKWGKTRFSTVLSYNGFTKQLDAAQYNFTYDLHCFEAVINVSETKTGFRAGRQIQFFLRLKALPFDGNFGFGTRGQAIGSGFGGNN